MAAVGGGRSTLANQGSLYHVSWRPRLPDAFERAQEGEAEPRGFLRERQLTGLSTRVIIQFLSICFIVNRPKARQIKWVKSDPVSAAFFLGNHYTIHILVTTNWHASTEVSSSVVEWNNSTRRLHRSHAIYASERGSHAIYT